MPAGEPGRYDYLLPLLSKMSIQEQQILLRVNAGETITQIAKDFQVSKTHISRTLGKLQRKYDRRLDEFY